MMKGLSKHALHEFSMASAWLFTRKGVNAAKHAMTATTFLAFIIYQFTNVKIMF